MAMIAGIILLILMVILIVLGIKSNQQEKEVQERLSTLSHSETTKKVLTRQKEMEKSFQNRVIIPFATKVFERFQTFLPAGSKSFVTRQLIQAGYQKPQDQKVFLGIQMLSTALSFIGVFSVAMMFGKFSPMINAMVGVGAGAVGYGFPLVYIVQEANKRKKSIQKSLPDFLDLLVICVEAGLGLDIAINKIATMKSVKTSAYLREELKKYTKDVGLGKARKQALLDLADRTGLDDFNAIINAIVQAYEMGTGVAHTLRIQSDSLRVKRLAKAEERANKIPVKMIPPIYFFLFPAIFVSIMGPIGVIMIEAIGQIMGNGLPGS